jgi:hypothetical protein
MRDRGAVCFEPVDETEEPTTDSVDLPTGETESTTDRSADVDRSQEAERDRYPLAGPILEGAGSRVLRGRCSGCEARLRVRLGGDQAGPVRVRCPICGKTRSVDV